MQNLNEWREWLNHASEQEWADFMAQHGDKLAAVKQAWAAFTTQQQIRQPENAADNASPMQPENANETATACRQDAAQMQPENNSTETTIVPSQPFTQTDFRQPENAATSDAQMQPENANGAATAHHQDAAQPQPENIATTEAQTPAQNNFRLPETQMQPENANETATACPQDNAQPQPETQSPTQPTPPMPKYTPTPLPNARHGEPYRAALPPTATAITFHPECGLTWDAAAQQIHGTPSQSGDVEIHYQIHENNNITPVVQKLYINPDPKSLWQNQPSDPTAPYAKPDTAHERIPTPQGSLIAARVRGRSHAHNGTHCDDDYRIAYHERTGLHFIAVADGAGSAAFSRYGSQLAVNAAANTVWQLLDDSEKDFFRLPQYDADNQKRVLSHLIRHAAYQAYAAQTEAAKAEAIPLKSLACTLLIALALPCADGTWLVAAYWVGDGAAAVWQPENQQLMLLGESDGGAYSGETVFLSAHEVSDNLAHRIRCWTGQQPPVLLLMTDGVSDPKFETDANLARPERWAELWQELQPALKAEQPAAALEEWLGFWSAGNHDDRTLALFLPTTAALPFCPNL